MEGKFDHWRDMVFDVVDAAVKFANHAEGILQKGGFIVLDPETSATAKKLFDELWRSAVAVRPLLEHPPRELCDVSRELLGIYRIGWNIQQDSKSAAGDLTDALECYPTLKFKSITLCQTASKIWPQEDRCPRRTSWRPRSPST